ncbi:MAG: hypothetical protein Q7U38_00915, partial [Methylobacter sp.]|nr:hypothetical protein [Methylobacter sp.]
SLTKKLCETLRITQRYSAVKKRRLKNPGRFYLTAESHKVKRRVAQSLQSYKASVEHTKVPQKNSALLCG